MCEATHSIQLRSALHLLWIADLYTNRRLAAIPGKATPLHHR